MLALYGVLWRHYMRRQGCPLRCSSAATTALTYRTQRPSSGGGLDLFYVVAKVAKRRAAIRVNEPADKPRQRRQANIDATPKQVARAIFAAVPPTRPEQTPPGPQLARPHTHTTPRQSPGGSHRPGRAAPEEASARIPDGGTSITRQQDPLSESETGRAVSSDRDCPLFGRYDGVETG